MTALKSGVSYEKPNFRTRAKLWDRVAKAYQEKFLGLEDAMEVLLACKVCTEEELDNDKYSVSDVYEIANEILGTLFQAELDKKK